MCSLSSFLSESVFDAFSVAVARNGRHDYVDPGSNQEAPQEHGHVDDVVHEPLLVVVSSNRVGFF